ncbi:MAG TPA: DUF1993 domain-containing protein [Hyphomicrobiaceae bacterium]|nr:DUF1993 domain-containing protein [Hyphomicrobiaceae bacterium]
MPVTMHSVSLPLFSRMLSNLSAILDKAEAYAAAKKIDPEVMLNARLAPDMFPLKRQVQLASDFAKGAAARLSGQDIPKWDDSEKSFAELKARLKRTQDYLAGFGAAQIDGSEARDVSLTIAQKPAVLKGQAFLTNYAFPHFFFHVTTAYNILRHNGVEVGKRDFMGPF